MRFGVLTLTDHVPDPPSGRHLTPYAAGPYAPGPCGPAPRVCRRPVAGLAVSARELGSCAAGAGAVR